MKTQIRNRPDSGRRKGRVRRSALLLSAGVGLGIAGKRLADRRDSGQGPGGEPSLTEANAPAPGAPADPGDAPARAVGTNPTAVSAEEWTVAAVSTSDPVSALRFGEQPGLLATEDAASAPDERLSANTSFANEVMGRDRPGRLDNERDDPPRHPLKGQ
ncbi:hypothetical protein [Parafrankia elaeagni]|uniref:hypothetical protein n=1 Tax=Parafrankia elaeagni TaxID=222534 RepID=UPI0012B65CF2|nr:hypothetical protein [Parafrankia elaeagni]